MSDLSLFIPEVTAKCTNLDHIFRRSLRQDLNGIVLVITALSGLTSLLSGKCSTRHKNHSSLVEQIGTTLVVFGRKLPT